MELKDYRNKINTENIQKPENCKNCPFSDHEAWCLVPGNWKERYYLPDDKISQYCPFWENDK